MSRNARIRQLQIVTPEEELENLRNEVGALQRTVESKSAAVAILRSELQECQRERDKFRTLAEGETLHRSSVSSSSKKPAYSDPCRSAMLSGSEGTLAQLLSVAKEESKTLRLDGTELRCKLHDAKADIKFLRDEIQRLRGTGDARRKSHVSSVTTQLAQQEREQFISQMESLSSRCQALEGDVRGLVEEREELVRELDASNHKIHRLNHILNTILRGTPSSPNAVQQRRVVDLDAIITENRYLQERLKQTEEEKTLVRNNALKYKTALEKCRSQGSMKLGTQENLIVTPKQVSELLRDYHGEVGGAAETDLKSLCVALVDALNQRSRALRTQRSANKMLANRVSELERRLAGFGNKNADGLKTTDENRRESEGSEPHVSSLSLMEGYIPPSGPFPKSFEETVLKDPRLDQLLSANRENSDVDPNPVTQVEAAEDNIPNGDTIVLSEKGSTSDDTSSDLPVETPELPVEIPELPVETPELPVRTPECRTPELPVRTPECRTPELPVRTPELPVRTPELPVRTPELPVRTPEIPVRTPELTGYSDVNNDVHETCKDIAVQNKSCDESNIEASPSAKVKARIDNTNDSSNANEVISISEDKAKSTRTKMNIVKDKRSKNVPSKIEEKNRSLDTEVSKVISKHKMKSAYTNPEDELEEIIPIDQLDTYMKEIQLKRKSMKATPVQKQAVGVMNKADNACVNELTDLEKDIESLINGNDDHEICKRSALSRENSEDNDSFDLDISDYDSDNDNLDLALQDWQKDCDKETKKKGACSKDMKKSGKKDKFAFWQKGSKQDVDSSSLKEFLEKATAS